MLIIDGETGYDVHGNVWQDESSELFETLQEIEIYFKQYKCSLIFGNISDDWKIYIANAFKCFNDEHYKAYLPIKDCYENPDFIHKMYSVLGQFYSSYMPWFEFDVPIHQFVDNIIISSKFPKILALSPRAIEKVSLKFINDDFIVKALKANPRILKFLPRQRITFSIALEAVKLDGAVLEYVPRYLRGNRTIADAAIESNPYALEYVHKKISNHSSFYIKAIEKIVDAAIESNPYALEYYRNKISNHSSFRIKAIEKAMQKEPWTELIGLDIIRDIYTNKQLEKIVAHFDNRTIKQHLWNLWKLKNIETDILLMAHMKQHFLGQRFTDPKLATSN